MATPAVPYAGLYAPQGPRPKSGWRWFVWVPLGVILSCVLFSLMRNQGRTFTSIPITEFNRRLRPISSDPNLTAPDRIEWIRLEGDDLYGKFLRAEDIPDKAPVTYFKVTFPPGLTSQYPFYRDLVDRVGGAPVSVEESNSLIVNILLPLIPWLLIFGFIWFFVFRHLRQARPGTQVVLSGPGRWIPDPPRQPGEAI